MLKKQRFKAIVKLVETGLTLGSNGVKSFVTASFLKENKSSVPFWSICVDVPDFALGVVGWVLGWLLLG